MRPGLNHSQMGFDMSDGKGVGGRPTKYKKEYNELAYNYCLLGATDSQLADFLGVHESTIHQWKHDYPSFSESLNRGKVTADAKVAESLYNRATGFSHLEEKVFNNQGEIISHTVNKHYPPDATSMIFWLKNRQPKLWRDNPDGLQNDNQPIGKIEIEVVNANNQDKTD